MHLLSPSADAGILLMNVALSSLILGSVAVVASLLLRRSSLVWRHRLLCITLALALASPILIWIAAQQGFGIVSVTLSQTDAQVYEDVSGASSTLKMKPSMESQAKLDVAAVSPAPTNKPIEHGSSVNRSLASDTELAEISMTGWLGVLVIALWAGGATIRFVRFLGGMFVVAKLKRSLRPSTDRRLITAATNALASVGQQRQTPIYESALPSAPLTIGSLRSLIVMPVGLADSLSDEQLACVLTHEVAHSKRHDTLVSLLQQIVGVGYWWNPLLSNASRQVSHLRELICDDHVVRQFGEGRALATAIVDVAEWSATRGRAFPLATMLLDDVDEVEERLRRLVEPDRPISSGLTARSALATGMFGILLFFVPLVPIVRAQTTEGTEPEKIDPTKPMADTFRDVRKIERKSFRHFLREASILVPPKCEGRPWSTVTAAMDGHQFPVVASWKNGDATHRYYQVERDAFKFPNGRSLDLCVLLSANNSKAPETENDPGNVYSADAALVADINSPYADVVLQKWYPQGTVLDLVLGTDEVQDVGLEWPLLKRISVSYGPLPDRWMEYYPSGYDVIVEFTATVDEKVAGKKMYFRIPSGLDPRKNRQGMPAPDERFVAEDTLGPVAGHGSGEWWAGTPEVVAANKKKYLAMSTSSVGIRAAGSNWTSSVDDPVLGIDDAAVSVITLYAGPTEGVQFVVWSDLPNSRGGSGGGQGTKASYKGRHRNSDGRQVDYFAESDDGKTGSITIDDVRYDFAKGAVFLISTQAGPTTIAQLSIDARSIPYKRSKLIELAKSNEEIREFFHRHKKKTNE